MFNVGIIGLGYIGVQHLQKFSDVAGVEVIAVADSNEDGLENATKSYEIANKFNDYNDLIALTNIDLVVVALPNYLHARVTIAALEAGHHVLCEKPMATTLQDADAMCVAAKRTGRVLSIVKNFRWEFFGPDAFHLRNLIADGEFGNIYHVRAQYLRRRTFPPSGYMRWNMSQEESGGGALIDLGPHMLDLAMWLLDDYMPRSVNGVTHAALMNESSVDDLASGAVRMASGASLQVDLAWSSNNEPAWSVSIYGDKGGAKIDAHKPAGQRITLFAVDADVPTETELAENDLTPAPEASLQEHVVQRMRAGETPECSAKRALQVMKVIDGWYQSSRSGAEVLL